MPPSLAEGGRSFRPDTSLPPIRTQASSCSRTPSLRPERAVGAIAALLLVPLLRHLPPWVFDSLPPCPVRLYLHLLCPGCGATRASEALLHGQLARAWQCNALFVLALPVLLLFGAKVGWRWIVGSPVPPSSKLTASGPRLPWPVTAVLLGIAGIFTVYRNL